MKRVLVINCGWEQEPLIARLASLGCQLFLVNHTDINDQLIEMAEDTLISSYFDITRIYDFAVSNNVEAVMSDQCDYAMYAVACVTNRLGLPGPNIATLLYCTNKYKQRSKLIVHEDKILQPTFRLVNSPNELSDFVKEHGFPVVVKPTDARGSFGVTVVRAAEVLEDSFWLALQNSISREVIVEMFIEGTEYTVDGYALSGNPTTIAIGEKFKHPEKSQVSMGIRYDIQKLETPLYERLARVNEVVASLLGIDFGFIHAEYIVNSEGDIYLVEMANRGGGCWTSLFVDSIASGIDTPSLLIESALTGKNSTTQNTAPRSCELRFFSLVGQGKVKTVAGIEKIEIQNDVIAVRLNLKIGDVINLVSNDANRHGFIIHSWNSDNPNLLFDSYISNLKVETE